MAKGNGIFTHLSILGIPSKTYKLKTININININIDSLIKRLGIINYVSIDSYLKKQNNVFSFLDYNVMQTFYKSNFIDGLLINTINLIVKDMIVVPGKDVSIKAPGKNVSIKTSVKNVSIKTSGKNTVVYK